MELKGKYCKDCKVFIDDVEDEKVIQPLKPVLRVATEKDDEQEKNNKIKSDNA